MNERRDGGEEGRSECMKDEKAGKLMEFEGRGTT